MSLSRQWRTKNRLAPLGTVECVNHCVEQKGFVITRWQLLLLLLQQQGEALLLSGNLFALHFTLYENINQRFHSTAVIHLAVFGCYFVSLNIEVQLVKLQGLHWL